MAIPRNYSEAYLRELLEAHSPEELLAKLRPEPEASEARAPRFPGGSGVNAESIEKRWSALKHISSSSRDALLPDPEGVEPFSNNIENAIGAVQIPVGIAGPIRVTGVHASGDYHVPLATTEAALVASYHRGACLISAAGGCRSVLLSEAVGRAPVFVFADIAESAEFVAWLLGETHSFREVAATTTSHGSLIDIATTVEANHVYLHLDFHTGDASGQNMVTIASQAVCDDIMKRSPVTPKRAYIEGNLSGDKKVLTEPFAVQRGRKVSSEISLPGQLVRKYLHTTPEEMVDYWQISAMGGVLGGTVGIQGHMANGLAALYLATGQDVACVPESAGGVTRFELDRDNGNLYAAVTVPKLMVATVGGGTGLPTQLACLDILGLSGSGNSRALAEVTAAILLAGELSIIGAMAAGHFTDAHQRLARG